MAKILDKETELALARAWKHEGSARAQARLVLSYQPMIRAIARRHLRPGLDLEDLVQEGVIGFMGALDNFNPDLGYGVGTLARFHITARIQLHVAEFSGLIRLPNSRKIKGLISGCVSRIRQAEAQKAAALTNLEREAICNEAGFDLAELEQFEMVMRPAKSLHQTCDDESPLQIAAEGGHAETTLIESQGLEEVNRIVAEVLAELPERTAYILRRRHLSEDFVSLDAIAEEIGVSRERVRRIELRALTDIQARLAERGITSLADIA